MPKVSVIVPVYGVEKYIERCARSLFEQTLDDIEYIFVDDCTPDRSIDILKALIEEYRLRFAEMNYTVRIERMPTNSGLPAVRRHGIQLATGDYIIHCDSDDWVDRDMYRLMYEKAVEDGAEAVICDYYIANETEEKSVIGVRGLSKQLIIADILSDKIAGSVWNKMFARKLYDNGITYPQGNMAEDVVLSIQLLFWANKISYVNQPLYFYFNNICSITKSRSKEKAISNFNAATDNAQLVLDFLKKNNVSDKLKNEINYFKYREKAFLNPFLKDYELYKKWKNVFPEVNFKIYFLGGITNKQKIKYFLLEIIHFFHW